MDSHVLARGNGGQSTQASKLTDGAGWMTAAGWMTCMYRTVEVRAYIKTHTHAQSYHQHVFACFVFLALFSVVIQPIGKCTGGGMVDRSAGVGGVGKRVGRVACSGACAGACAGAYRVRRAY